MPVVNPPAANPSIVIQSLADNPEVQALYKKLLRFIQAQALDDVRVIFAASTTLAISIGQAMGIPLDVLCEGIYEAARQTYLYEEMAPRSAPSPPESKS